MTCTHPKLEYVGQQEIDPYDDSITMSLYTCRDCHSTISKETIQKIHGLHFTQLSSIPNPEPKFFAIKKEK